MKINVLTAMLFGLLWGCASKSIRSDSDFFHAVSIDTLLNERIHCRAIAVTSEKVWYAGNQGKVGSIDIVGKKKNQNIVDLPAAAAEFRSIAKTSKAVFVLNSGNPARLYRFSNDLLQKELVYEEKHEKVFYDSMQFWNDNEGMAVGDPTEDCLSIIRTHDGGKNWKKISCVNLPKLVPGEAAFAASNTNLILKGNHAWIVLGGKQSRVFHSSDKGNHWEVYETPIVQGSEMTGIYTADFYDAKIGFIAGGNYDKQNNNFQNKAITYDGGKSWKLVGENLGFGYASCIQFVPNSQGAELVCIAGDGLYYSHDFGASWKMLLATKELYTLRFLDSNTAFAAGRNGVFKIEFQ